MQKFPLTRAPLYAAFSLSLTLGLVACGGGTNTTPVTITAPGGASSASLTAGQTLQLTASGTVTWSSSDNSVATVDANGLVTAVGPGTATITATSTTDASKTATFTVTVTGAAFQPVRVSFRPANATTALPAGFVADNGAAFGTGNRTWGWEVEGTGAPTDASANTRDRNTATTADPSQRTLILMQCNNANPACATGSITTPLQWEYTLPNGKYNVTVSVGDPTSFNSVHVIRAEGTVILPAFTPSAASPFSVKTAPVTVSDGRLTIDAVGGTNTKLNYVTIEPATTTTSVR